MKRFSNERKIRNARLLRKGLMSKQEFDRINNETYLKNLYAKLTSLPIEMI